MVLSTSMIRVGNTNIFIRVQAKQKYQDPINPHEERKPDFLSRPIQIGEFIMYFVCKEEFHFKYCTLDY